VNLSQFAIPEAGQQFKASDFRALLNPGVYLYILGEVPLYVGLGKCLLYRESDPKHKQAKRARAEADTVKLYPCVSFQAARDLETILIGRIKPKYNVNIGMYVRKILGLRNLAQSTRQTV